MSSYKFVRRLRACGLLGFTLVACFDRPLGLRPRGLSKQPLVLVEPGHDNNLQITMDSFYLALISGFRISNKSKVACITRDIIFYHTAQLYYRT